VFTLGTGQIYRSIEGRKLQSV